LREEDKKILNIEGEEEEGNEEEEETKEKEEEEDEDNIYKINYETTR